MAYYRRHRKNRKQEEPKEESPELVPTAEEELPPEEEELSLGDPILPEEESDAELPESAEIIGVNFRGGGKTYYFSANGVSASEGDHVIVETARGIEYGNVSLSNRVVSKNEIVSPLKDVLRAATAEDDARFEANLKKEEEARQVCEKKISEHSLDMKLVDVEYTFDNSKLLFYFTSDDRVDFRELVKDLASIFHTRIELRQIGIRDEAKMLGGLGICGRPFCCSSFLHDFVQVSIKMAKDQNLSLNSSKISGACGRLMCCLRYEYDTYVQELKKTPRVDAHVITPDGAGKVIESRPLAGVVKVALDADPANPKLYTCDKLRTQPKEQPKNK